MAKKKSQTERPRTDAERRARQCERISRALRVLQCIVGPGRWDVQALADELECSTRTIQRVLQTLSMAGVPYRYDAELHAYKVPRGFRFPGIGSARSLSDISDIERLRSEAKRMLRDAARFSDSLQSFYEALGNGSPNTE
jgi:hypothetical protein